MKPSIQRARLRPTLRAFIACAALGVLIGLVRTWRSDAPPIQRASLDCGLGAELTEVSRDGEYIFAAKIGSRSDGLAASCIFTFDPPWPSMPTCAIMTMEPAMLVRWAASPKHLVLEYADPTLRAARSTIEGRCEIGGTP